MQASSPAHQPASGLAPWGLPRSPSPTPLRRAWSCCMTPWVVRAGSLIGRVGRALFLECCLQRSRTAFRRPPALIEKPEPGPVQEDTAGVWAMPQAPTSTAGLFGTPLS